MNIKYINIPSNLLFDIKVSSFAKLLYGELCVLSYKNGVCKVSNEFLAKINNCSIGTIKRALRDLKDNRYINISNSPQRKIVVVQI